MPRLVADDAGDGGANRWFAARPQAHAGAQERARPRARGDVSLRRSHRRRAALQQTPAQPAGKQSCRHQRRRLERRHQRQRGRSLRRPRGRTLAERKHQPHPGAAVALVPLVQLLPQQIEATFEAPAHGSAGQTLPAGDLRRRQPLGVTEQDRRPVRLRQPLDRRRQHPAGLVLGQQLLGRGQRLAGVFGGPLAEGAAGGPAVPHPHEVAQHRGQPRPQRRLQPGRRLQRRRVDLLDHVVGGGLVDQAAGQPAQPGGLGVQRLGRGSDRVPVHAANMPLAGRVLAVSDPFVAPERRKHPDPDGHSDHQEDQSGDHARKLCRPRTTRKNRMIPGLGRSKPRQGCRDSASGIRGGNRNAQRICYRSVAPDGTASRWPARPRGSGRWTRWWGPCGRCSSRRGRAGPGGWSGRSPAGRRRPP